MTLRDIALVAYRRNHSPENWHNFRELRNRCVSSIRAEKKKYANKFLNKNLNGSNLWKRLKSVGATTKIRYEPLPESCCLDELNTAFATIHHTEASIALPQLESSDEEHRFYFSSTHEEEVCDAINGIKSKAIGDDGISPAFIKLLLPVILSSITDLFNTCLTKSTFPTNWKTAKIIPLLKSSVYTGYGDLRPISLLPCLSEAMEAIMYTQIRDHIQSNNYLNQFQSAFRKGHSTETALIKISQDIARSIDRRHVTVLVLLDLSKAFDCVSRVSLIQKL